MGAAPVIATFVVRRPPASGITHVLSHSGILRHNLGLSLIAGCKQHPGHLTNDGGLFRWGLSSRFNQDRHSALSPHLPHDLFSLGLHSAVLL